MTAKYCQKKSLGIKTTWYLGGIYTTFAGRAEFANNAPIMLLADFLRDRAEDVSGRLNEQKFCALQDALWHRRTTKAADEPLCCFTILGLDPGPLLSLVGSDKELLERRMEIIMEQFKQFPTGFPFHRCPRLQKGGFRWAPKSLMGRRRGGIEDDCCGDDEKRPCEATNGAWPGRGLTMVGYPGIKLKSISPRQGTTFVVSVQRGDERPARYSIQLSPNEMGNI
ncbi:hypothetical protein K440DRAFT_627088, partial [Wilcoxina mikolae CBS 423.85]